MQSHSCIQVDISKIDYNALTNQVDVLAQTPDEEALRGLIRKGTIANKFVPVLCGSAFKNKGVQPLLDAGAHPFPMQGSSNVCVAIELSMINSQSILLLTALARLPCM